MQFFIAFGRPHSQNNSEARNLKNDNFMNITNTELLKKKILYSQCKIGKIFEGMKKDAIKAEISDIQIK